MKVKVTQTIQEEMGWKHINAAHVSLSWDIFERQNLGTYIVMFKKLKNLRWS